MCESRGVEVLNDHETAAANTSTLCCPYAHSADEETALKEAMCWRRWCLGP